ncbi:hypothetical protein B0H11DRAFT_2378317 [Mycena galericulata]|nr:hypothetical protein B0H11DRAFT_2378317 [Mycena galericulata]
MFASLILVSVLAAAANADHRITLRNNCPWGVGMTLSNFPHNGAAYNGELSTSTSFCVASVITRPTLAAKMTASAGWTFNSANIGGQDDYDISNIQGFSVVRIRFPFFNTVAQVVVIKAQQIIPDSGCDTVTCTSVDCPCNEAYRPGDTSGTCGGTGPLDQATRTCGSSGYTVVYCP